MNNTLTEKLFEIKIDSKSACFFIQPKATDDENNILDRIATKISQTPAIIILSGENLSDKKFIELTEKVRYLCSEFDSTLLIHNRADIAFLTEADGIYLDSAGISSKQVANIIGENSIIIEEADNLLKITKSKEHERTKRIN